MLDINKIYKTKNYGCLKIIKYNDYDNVTVEFIDTGYIKNTRTDQIEGGLVRDCLVPSACGVGYIGDGKYKSRSNNKKTKKYEAWVSMMRRCYKEEARAQNPTYKGCTVCAEWHNFQNFAKWFDDNYIEGFQIDKDIKVKGNKIYSPQTCAFVSPQDNIIEAHAKHYKLLNPNGDIVEIYNMTKFCKGSDLKRSSMCALGSGRLSQYKGWKRINTKTCIKQVV